MTAKHTTRRPDRQAVADLMTALDRIIAATRDAADARRRIVADADRQQRRGVSR